MLFVGNDWAEDHHDVELVDDDGRRLARRRLTEGIEGIAQLHELIAGHLPEDATAADVVVGIETDRGPWVTALVAAGYQVFAINPMQVARYRERHSTSGAKSDQGDAHTLAELVRLDRAHHRPVAGDSDLTDAVRVLARSHQNLVWLRQRQGNQLRSQLREYFPAALMAFPELTGRDALAVLTVATTPQAARDLDVETIIEVLRQAGRQRNLRATATRIHQALTAEHLAARPLTAQAFGITARALVGVLAELNRQITELESQVSAYFGRHPDAEIYLSQPGFGTILGARALAEFGDDPDRYASGKARRNYAGTSPITRASGKKIVVLARYARNRRLGDALFQQAFAALTGSAGARAYYDAMRARGIGHNDALRRLANRLVGTLHGCLRTHTTYSETTAWTPQTHHTDQAA
ncbi:IS110 family transposase [Actinomadura soli]|uniref:IS110 family transposase n=1 Tax=Actinomadura soli TaxID=2508997 RepID=A0A5C4IXW0_9ACTN|nr:IS110 family transposase [Actinomadura soli]TMQ80545.1 IS110 family transposase [Actinomadura soli]